MLNMAKLLLCYTFSMMTLFCVQAYNVHRQRDHMHQPQEKEHDPYWMTLPWTINNTVYLYLVNGTSFAYHDVGHTPNWQLEEPPFAPWYNTEKNGRYTYQEINRPYRVSPAYHRVPIWTYWNPVVADFNPTPSYWHNYIITDEPGSSLGCYCTTVWKRFTLLAGCAVITYRHILTTATSTELILKNNRHRPHLDEILGFWYQSSPWYYKSYNDTYYQGVSRIHYHWRYLRPEKVNISHPLPFTYDLAIWATPGVIKSSPVLCERASPSWWWYESSRPYRPQMAVIVGHQYIKSHGKIPNPWFKYGTRTDDFLDGSCPKLEWGEFLCIGDTHSETWSKYGIESGAAWHRIMRFKGWAAGYNGLAAMCAFSMRLRHESLMHYFTMLNVHPVLDWMFNAYQGNSRYEFLDYRYQDSKGKAPVPHSWHYYEYGWGPVNTKYPTDAAFGQYLPPLY